MKIIVAVDNQGGFGKEGKIPWHFKCDFAHFKNVTSGHVCVMGKNTYTDMVAMISRGKGRVGKDILPDRKCYVISSTLKESKGVTVVADLKDIPEKDIFICGGERLYNQAIKDADTVYMTVIDKHYECDRFFPVELLEKDFKIIEGKKEIEKDTELMFVTYTRIIRRLENG